MLQLRKLSENDGKDVYDILQLIDANENGFINHVKDTPYEMFGQWLKQNVDISNAINLPDGFVQQTTYWLYDDDKPVGTGRIRHYLNDALRENGGNIGYAIASPYRSKGYGKEILRLLLIECEEMGLTEVLLDPYKTNEWSNQVILKNGGKLVRETDVKNYYIIKV